MYAVLVVIHIIVSIFLIAVILLQAGRGGGLADSFGGSQIQSLFGTKSTTILTKLTTICAIMFILTCLSLAMISTRMSRSLVEKIEIPEAAKKAEADLGGGEEQETMTPSPEGRQGGPNETEVE